jgi:hypothetical protein
MSEDGIKTEENRIKDEKGLFIKGNPGGPGRPKGSFSLVEMIKNKLQEMPEGKDKTYAEYFIEQMMKKSVIEGDTTMMKDMINRVDGMPKQAVDHTTQGEKIQGVVMLPHKNGSTENSLATASQTE